MLRLQTLGGLALTSDGAAPSGAATQRRRLALLAALAVAGRRGMSRDGLLALLWPDRDAAGGRQALSQALYALRRDSGVSDLVLGVGAEELRLNPAALTSDVGEFEDAIARAAWDEAAALYAGPFLDGVYLGNDAEGVFERWADGQRARLGLAAERALETLAAAAQARGDHEAAAGWWRRLTAIDPLRTRAAAGLIQSLAALGDRGAALRHAEWYGRRVREELDAEPSAAVAALAERLRADPGVAPAAPADEGLLAGRYRLGPELGRGGMAVVLLAHDVRHDRRVAVKMLRPELNDAVDRDRMLREIRVTARLQHPHVLPLHDSGEHRGQLFYVMPYVEGETLRARLQRDRVLPVPLALRLAREVADALEHAHRQQIVHRDVKPENVLLTGTGDGEDVHAIVADFGIAHLVAEAAAQAAPAAQRLTRPQFAMGTPAYMSPEQLLADPSIDGRSDVFALGCVLYEMLAGRPPWIGATPQALLARRFAEAPPPIRTLRPEAPASAEAALHRALAVEPSERFASARRFADALAAPAAPPSRLAAARVPAPATGLVGRERELRAAASLLTRPDVRLLTLTGAGGTGKTSLAIHLAAAVAEAFEETAFVDLSTLSEPALLPAQLAAALGVRDREDLAPIDAVAAAVGARRLLLVLDNLEQIIAAAPDVARLLAGAPRLTVLATSRVRLRLRGEHEFFVAPLGLPDLADVGEALAAAPAVSMFLARAREASPDLDFDDEGLRTVAEICVRLDGLPLAIELAAARTRLLAPRAILARLEERRLDFLTGGARDLPSRHRTLRGAIAWSQDLLDGPQRAALRALGVFAGPFSLPRACAVLGVPEDEGLALVQALLDASLVRRIGDDEDGPRLVMLETIRAFAEESLAAAGEADGVRRRHLAQYAELAEQVAPALTGATQGEGLARLARDWGNLRAALATAEALAAGEDPRPLVRLCRALWRAWLVSGAWSEGREWLRRALRHAPPGTEGRAELLAASGTLAQNQGDYQDASACVEAALTEWRARGDAAGEARALASLGWLAWRRCRFAEGRALSQESLALYRALGDERGTAQALNNLGWIALFEGRGHEAVAVLGESLAIRRRLGDQRDVAFVLTTLAWATARVGEREAADAELDEAVSIFRSIGERQLYAFAARVSAEIALTAGRADDARAILETVSVPIFREIGDRWGLYVALGVLGDQFLARGEHAAAAAAYAESEAIARELGDGFGAATSLARSALLADARGDAAGAAAFAGEARAAMARVGGALPPWLAERMPQGAEVVAST